MIVIDTAVTIERTPEQVFDYIGTHMLEHARLWNPNIVEMENLTGGPLRAGTRVREKALVQGKPHGRIFELGRFEAPRVVELRGVEADAPEEHFLARYSFTPEGAGHTRVDFHFELHWDAFMFKYVRPLVRFFIGSDVRKIVGVRLKELIEAEPAR